MDCWVDGTVDVAGLDTALLDDCVLNDIAGAIAITPMNSNELDEKASTFIITK
jgi:hypothetical protein